MKNLLKIIGLLILIIWISNWNVEGEKLTHRLITKVENVVYSFKLRHQSVPKTDDKIQRMDIQTPSNDLDWIVAEASFYDPHDIKQVGGVKKKADGIGASGREVSYGSVAMDSTFIKDIANNYKGCIVYIQIRQSKLETPFGVGVYRVDDTMGKDFTHPSHLDFFHKDVPPRLKKKGRFKVMYRVAYIKKY